MYQDMLVVFSEHRTVVHADVWRRHFPDGRQRRLHIARYTLDLPPGAREPQALLAALQKALAGRPDYVLGSGA